MSRSPLRLLFLFLGKTKETYLAAGIDDFQNRLKRYATVSINTIKEKRFSSKSPSAMVIKEEGNLLLSHLPKGAMLVSLDRTGRQLSSQEFATLLEKWEEQGRSQVSFAIGGAFGLSAEVLDKSDLVISFSKMTFTHEMARLLLLEQLYRAFTIRAGTRYHK